MEYVCRKIEELNLKLEEPRSKLKEAVWGVVQGRKVRYDLCRNEVGLFPLNAKTTHEYTFLLARQEGPHIRAKFIPRSEDEFDAFSALKASSEGLELIIGGSVVPSGDKKRFELDVHYIVSQEGGSKRLYPDLSFDINEYKNSQS